MKALLDTNIIIHRENNKVTSFSIGELFRWLDALKYEKMIHPYSIKELRKYSDSDVQRLYDVKLEAYTRMNSIAPLTEDTINLLKEFPDTPNGKIDNQLLNEVYCGRVDILITEDREMLHKANKLGIADKVFTINMFLTKATKENPSLVDYKTLAVKKEYFGNINVNDPFFDTFREAYPSFNTWFNGKFNEEAYICRNDKNQIIGFLYLKTEGKDENYEDIFPKFKPARRLKVGTFKVEASGFRLGERFIKIIFDNAIKRDVDEIYVTLYKDRIELINLYDLLRRWGFTYHGIKRNSDNREETVLVKLLGKYNSQLKVKENFPNLDYSVKKFFLPIEAKYHTRLLPDSILCNENEVDLIKEEPQQYALQKVYISYSFKRNMSPGDLIVVYRKGLNQGRKAYESVISSICVIDEIKYDFRDKDEFMNYCENRTVFTTEELNSIWVNNREKILVVKFIFVASLNSRLILKELWDLGIVQKNEGPRPFDEITDSAFEKILINSKTNLYGMEKSYE